MDIIFDLDGTLIDEDTTLFYKILFGELLKRFNMKFGVEKDVFVPAMHKTMVEMGNVDGSEPIASRFFKTLSELISIPESLTLAEFEEFFNNEFDKVLVAYKAKPTMAKVVQVLKEQGHRLIIATDPFLPKVAVDKKIEHCGLNIKDFHLVTYNADCNYVKTSPKFFEELFQRLHTNPKNAIVIGNTIPTDIPAFPVRAAFILQETVREKGSTNMPYSMVSCEELLEMVESATNTSGNCSE